MNANVSQAGSMCHGRKCLALAVLSHLASQKRLGGEKSTHSYALGDGIKPNFVLTIETFACLGVLELWGLDKEGDLADKGAAN